MSKMDTFWISCCFYIGVILFAHPTNGQSEFEVQLVVRKYVEKGSSVTLYCKHNVKPQILYKVSWLRNDVKFFEYINGRNPPYRNFSVPGAEIDWSNSNEEQVTLKHVDFEAAGDYYCEVSTSTPIFTKPSQDEQLHVILPQTGPPRMSFNKRHYAVGERLIANCTTSKARPAPHITWLINGKKVDEKHIRSLHPYTGSKNIHRSKSHPQQQNSPPVDRIESGKSVRGGFYSSSSGSNRRDDAVFDFPYETHRHSSSSNNNNHNTNNNNYNNPFSQMTNSHEINHKTFDNKYYEIRKHRNSFNRKYRRYVNEALSNMGSSANIGMGNIQHNLGNTGSIFGGTIPGNVAGIGSNMGSGSSGSISGNYPGSGSNINNLNVPGGNSGGTVHHSSSTGSSGPNIRTHRGIMSASQISIEIGEHHIGSSGRLEITCLATIPAHVGPGEQFADYKTYSVKIDIEKPEMTSFMPPMSGMAALGNGSYGRSVHHWPVTLSIFCLTLLNV